MSYVQLQENFIFKLILFGNPKAGKTTLIKRLENNIFMNDLPKTIGVNFAKVTHVIKEYYIDNIPLSMLLWDFSGEKRFLPYFKMWLRGTAGGIFLFDMTSLESFESFDYWKGLIDSELDYDFPIYFVASKKDLEENRVVSREMVKKKIDHHFPYFECSSKSGENVEKIFKTICHEIFLKRKSYRLIHNG